MIVGGSLPLVLGTLLYFVLPESVQFLKRFPAASTDVRAWASRLWPNLEIAVPTAATPVAYVERASFALLFKGVAWRMTLPLWSAFFMSLLVLYFMVNWIPALLTRASFAPSIGVLAIFMFSLGGITGTVLQGPMMKSFGLIRSVLSMLVLAGIMVIALAEFELTKRSISLITFSIGWTLQGAQAGLNTFAAIRYPISMRTMGLGWALGAGRAGSVVGGMLGGLALSAGWLPQSILLAAAVPIVLCGVAFGCAALGGTTTAVASSPKTQEIQS
jgi:AAHS family 4-hydroxybenzoate transporter-like MFS transporter